jgi:macrolide-specific efflux system membrane fusion protein
MWAIIGIGVMALAVAGFLFLRPSPPELATASVRIGDIEQTVLATGKIRPKELVSVGAQVSGQVKRLYVVLGQRVRAGDPIAEIDPRPQQLALRNAEASVTALRAQRAGREGALVQAELAFRRQRTMLAADASARADYEAAHAALLALRGEMASLDAQIEAGRTQVETARINLGYTKVSAPMDGVIVAVVTKQGQTVNAFQSAPTIVMLARLDVMTVRAEISEGDIARVRPGQPVWFTTLGTPDERRDARIERIEPAPESIATEASGSQTTTSAATPTAIYYNALFDVPNTEGRLRPSMTAQVTVRLAQARRAVLMPLAALGTRDRQGRYSVRVVDERGDVETRKVRTGISDDSDIVVLAGLRPGQKVVIAQAAAAAPPEDSGGLF